MNNKQEDQPEELTLKERVIKISGLKIYESNDIETISYCGIGGRVWRPAVVLASFLQNYEKHKLFVDFENKNVLELGAGTGVCGLITATLKANKVFITDRDPGCLEVIQSNVEMNLDKLSDDKVEVHSLDWTDKDEISKFEGKVDVLLGSDLIYSYFMIDYLISALEFLSNKSTTILFSLANRGSSGGEYDQFVNSLKSKGWSVEIIPEEFILEKFYNINILLIKKCL